MKIIFLSLFIASILHAQELSGIGSGPLPAKDLGHGLSFAVVVKPGTQALHWKIVKAKTATSALDSIMSGESIRPGEKYAWFWDPKTGILWFATPKSIMDIKLNDWSFTSALYRATAEFETYPDLPPALKTEIPKILK